MNNEKVIILLIITILVIRIFNPTPDPSPGPGPGTGVELVVVSPSGFVNETLKSYVFENITYTNDTILYNNKTCTLTYNNVYNNVETLIPQYGSHTDPYEGVLVYLETPRCDIRLYYNNNDWWGEYWGNRYPDSNLVVSTNLTNKFIMFINYTHKYLDFSPNLYNVSNHNFVKHVTSSACGNPNYYNYKYYLYPHNNIFVVTCTQECNPKLIC